MIIPMKCMTCGRPISHLWRSYVNKRNEYDSFRKTDAQGYEKEHGTESPELLAMKDLKIIGYKTGIPWMPKSVRICCSRHFLGCPEGLADVIS